MKKVLVPLANGFEEIEAIAIIDILRRGEVEVTTTSIHEQHTVTGSHNIQVRADSLFDEVKDKTFDMIVLPGGGQGVINIGQNSSLVKAIKNMSLQNSVAAICAAPSLLAETGILKDKKATSYPSFRDKLIECGVQYADDNVIKDGNVTTSRGPATAIDFSLQLVKDLMGEAVYKKVAHDILFL